MSFIKRAHLVSAGRTLVWLLLFVLAGPASSSNSAEELPTESVVWYAGAASVVVNPPTGHYLAGYGRDRKSTGVLDNLFAKAVVIRDDKTRIGLLTLDSIGLTRPDIERVRARVAETLPGFLPEHLVVSSTHTHSGPDVVGLWGESLWRSGRDEAYMQALTEQLVKALALADKNAVPVTSRVGSALVPLPWVTNRSEPGLLDSTMAVLQFLDSTGTSVATLTNYACHPTVLGGDNTRVSSDYVGEFYQVMGRALPGEHLFLQGAIGGWVQPLAEPAAPSEATFAALEAYGLELAREALGVLQAAQSNPRSRLRMKSQTFTIDLENWGFRLLIWLGVLERESWGVAMRTVTSWLQIGDAQFVTHPGETSPAYSLASRELLQSPHSFVLGLSQDALGYILKPGYFADDVSYPHAEYLQSVSVGPEAGPALMQALGELVAEAN